MSGDMIEDPAQVVILDLAAHLDIPNWNIRKRFLWHHPELEELIWNARIKIGSYGKICGKITEGKMLYVIISRARWTPQFGTRELDIFKIITEIAKDVATTLDVDEVAMTFPSIP